MIVSTLRSRHLICGSICAITFLAASAVPAQDAADQAKAAGAVPLSTVLLEKVDNVVKKVESDPAAKVEYMAAGKDAGARPENMTELVETKYPKLAALFKTTDMPPFEFMNASGAIFMTAALSETETAPEDERAAANIKFYKANKERVTATMNRLEAAEKGGTEKTAPASPSSSTAPTP
ncbi:MAG: hypothetical protein ACJ8M1_15445 [Chthoniobacterales bacterium]